MRNRAGKNENSYLIVDFPTELSKVNKNAAYNTSARVFHQHTVLLIDK